MLFFCKRCHAIYHLAHRWIGTYRSCPRDGNNIELFFNSPTAYHNGRQGVYHGSGFPGCFGHVFFYKAKILDKF